MRLFALAFLAVLAACGPSPTRMLDPEVISEQIPAAGPERPPSCQPGDDDGIGGTGCQVD